MYVKQCKVCNSHHKGLIEELLVQKMSPEKIHEHLLALKDPMDRKIVVEEKINPSSIRRHSQRHFDQKEDQVIQHATIKSKTKKSRENFESGVKISVDKVNTVSHAIEIALIRMEEVETLSDSKKHQYTIGYLGQIKSLIDELSKITGEMKQEGTIDANFFRTEINTFAEIVLYTIRALDIQYDMGFELETAFSTEFKKQMSLYRKREDLIFSGQLSPNDGEKERNANNFNDSKNLV